MTPGKNVSGSKPGSLKILICALLVLMGAWGQPNIAVGQDAGPPANHAVEKAAEKAAEKTAQKTAQEAAAKAEQKARRPDEWRGTTKVFFIIYVVDIDAINDANQSLAANVYIRLRWKDPRLANPSGLPRQVPLQEVWNPRVLLANRFGTVSRSLPEVVDVQTDGTVIYHQRYTGNLSEQLNLSAFPLDTHDFIIHFVAAGYSSDEIEFVEDSLSGAVGGGMAKTLSLSDWKILKTEPLVFPYEAVKGHQTPGFAFRFKAKRYFNYYLWQVVLPLTVVVVMSWAGFWVGLEHVGVRIGVATSILTLVALRFALGGLLPKLPYMTRMDYFTVGCTLLVFLALVEGVAPLPQDSRGSPEKSI